MTNSYSYSGYDVELTGVIGIYQSIFEDVNYSGVVFCAKVTGGKATPTKEHPEVIWASEDEISVMTDEGKILIKYLPYALSHYMERGAYSLDLVSAHNYTK